MRGLRLLLAALVVTLVLAGSGLALGGNVTIALTDHVGSLCSGIIAVVN